MTALMIDMAVPLYSSLVGKCNRNRSIMSIASAMSIPLPRCRGLPGTRFGSFADRAKSVNQGLLFDLIKDPPAQGRYVSEFGKASEGQALHGRERKIQNQAIQAVTESGEKCRLDA
jgi:hypothetical protein